MSLTYTTDPTTGEDVYNVDLLYNANYEQENLSELYTIKEAVIDQYIDELNSLGTPEAETVKTKFEDLKQQMSVGLTSAITAASVVRDTALDIYSNLKNTFPIEAIKYRNYAFKSSSIGQALSVIDLSNQIAEEGLLQGGISGSLSIATGIIAGTAVPAHPIVKVAIGSFAGVVTNKTIDFIFDEGIEPAVQAIKDMIAERVIQESQNNPTQDITYKIQNGDTVWGIAQKYGMTVDEVIALNLYDETNNPDGILTLDEISDDRSFILIRLGEKIKVCPGWATYLKGKDEDLFMGSLTSNFADAEALTITRPPVDPLILDLDGDGIETTTIGDGIYFDHETDGFAEKTSWTGNNNVIMFDKYYIKQTA